MFDRYEPKNINKMNMKRTFKELLLIISLFFTPMISVIGVQAQKSSHLGFERTLVLLFGMYYSNSKK